MKGDRISDDDAELDAALRALPEPELPHELRQRLDAIPERGRVRRLHVPAFRVSAFGWAAAAALGLFIGARSAASDVSETASSESRNSETVSAETDEDETLELAVGSFGEFDEEP